MKAIFMAAMALALAGCVSTGTQVADSALTQFQKGITTEAEVQKALGAPQTVLVGATGLRTIWYVGVHAQPKASSFIPVVGAFAGGGSSTVSMVSFSFDADGLLIEMSSQQSQTGSRIGLGAPAQPMAPAPTAIK